MALITPELLAEIKAAFLQWFQGLLSGGSRNSAEMLRLIESLIRYRLIKSLGPATPKDPVLGGIGVAYGPLSYFDGVPCPFRMDTGLIVIELFFDGSPKPFPAWSEPWGSTAAAGFIPPLLIYTGEDLQGYLLGSGTAVPGVGSGNEYLIGEESEDASRPCPQFAELSITDWPNTAPALSATLQALFGFSSYEAYASSVYLKFTDLYSLLSNCGAPGNHTGLLRLAVQGKIGAGRSPAELAVWLEGSCPLRSWQDGIFRDDNGVYWLFGIDEFGCYTQRMKQASCTICINDWITDGLVTGSDLIKAQAFVFAGLTPDYAYAQVELLSAAALSDIYEEDESNNRVREPLGDTGWNYSHGHLGTGDGLVYEAAIVVHELVVEIGVTQHRLASLYRIEFDLSGLTPTASLKVDVENSMWEPTNRDMIAYPLVSESGNKICFVQRSFDSEDSGSNAPLYCWYMREGLERIRYNFRAEGTMGTIPPAHGFQCGPGSYTHTRFVPQNLSTTAPTFNGSIEAERSGYVMDRRVPRNAQVWVATVYHTEAELGAGCSYSGSFFTQMQNDAELDCNGPMDTSGWPTGGTVTIFSGTGEGYLEEVYMTNPVVYRILIIPHSTECVYMIEVIAKAAIDYKDTETYFDPNTFSTPLTLAPRTDGEKASEGFSVSVKNPIRPGAGVVYGFPCGGGGDYTTDLRRVDNGTSGQGTLFVTSEAALVTNHGVFSSEFGYLEEDYFTGWAEWATAYFDPVDKCVDTEMWTDYSYQYSEVYYSYGPSTRKELIGKADWPAGTGNLGYAIDAPGQLTKTVFAGWN